MSLFSEHSSRDAARPEPRPVPERDYQRRIDCAPRQGREFEPDPQIGRGRGAPESDHWLRRRAAGE